MNETELQAAFCRVRAGDKEAFAHVYNELKGVVFTVVCRIVRSRAIAEEITHDVFVKLYVSPPAPSIRNMRAWIFRMARNLAIDALRKKETVNLEDVQISAESEDESCVLKMDVEAAIGKLPCTERQIVTLHLNGGLTFADIAGIVDLSLPAVYRKYRKAIGTLRDELNGGFS